MTNEPAEDVTPIDRPLMRSDLNDIRKAVHDVSDKTLAMYEATMGAASELRAARATFRTYVAICAAACFFSVVGAVISVVTTTAHARSIVVSP